MAPDPLRVAETERDHAGWWQRQVELLGGPAPESEVLW
jgi:hypothetical protein